MTTQLSRHFYGVAPRRGAAALLKSIDSSLTPADIILLTEQADANTDLQFKTLSGGRPNRRCNAESYAALDSA